MPRVGLRASLAVLVLVGLLAALLTGCAQLQVRRVATGGGPVVYDLRGSDPAQLRKEAERRCPRGFEVMLQSDRLTRVERDEIYQGGLWNQLNAFFEDRDTSAQMTVACKDSPPAP